MGQRLVLNFTRDGESVVTLYQHWSGYTANAFSTLLQISEKGTKLGMFDDNNDVAQTFRALLRVLLEIGHIESTSEEETISEWSKYISKDEITTNLNKEADYMKRSEGLVSINPTTMDLHLDYAEMLIYIDIETFSLDIRQLFDTLDLDEFDEEEHEYLVSGTDITVEKLVEQSTPLGYDDSILLSDTMAVDDLSYIVSDSATTVYQLNGMTDAVLVDFA